MRVAAYYPWVYLRGGGERLLLELITRSRHDWTLFTNRFEPEATFPGFGSVPIMELERVSVRRTVRDVGKAGLTLLGQRLPFDDHDIVMVCQESLGSLVALRTRRLPVFCVCLTPLRVAYDPETRRRFLATRPGLATRLGLRAFTLLDRFGWRRFDRVFCISEEVASRVRNARLVPDERIRVVYPGVDVEYFEPNGSAEPFFLLPGRIMWTKNIELGIRAFHQLRQESTAAARYRLVVAGVVDRKSRPYLQKLRDLAGPDGGVEFIVDPSDRLYKELHQRCHAVLFTAFNEDWGFVPLEAMATQKPVIAVGQGGPAESVLDGETGYLCPPDPGPFSRAMRNLVEEPGLAEKMGRAGRRRAESFTWSNFVDQIDDYIEAAVGMRDQADGRPSGMRA